MIKPHRFRAIYLKRILLFAFILWVLIEESLSFCSIYAESSLGHGKGISYSDEDFLSSELSVISLSLLSNDSSVKLDRIKEFAEEYSPDILGLQGADITFSPLLNSLSGLSYGISDRTYDNGEVQINTVPILYKTERFEAIDLPSSHGVYSYNHESEDSVLSWVVLKERSSQNTILVLNTRFSKDDPLSNARKCAEITDRIRNEFGDIPTILLGDMGITQTDLAFRFLLNTFSDSASVSDRIYSSYNSKFAAGAHTDKENYPTDHILLSKNNWDILSYTVIRNDITLNMSDHYPVIVKLKINFNGTKEHKYGNLKITGAFKHSTQNDFFEIIEILNSSSFPVDLYDYRLFYLAADSKEELLSSDPNNVTKNMRISLVRGKYILQPKESAIVWLVSSDHYTSFLPLITQGNYGAPIYQTELLKKLCKDSLKISFPKNSIVVPLDRTSASYFVNGQALDLKNSFYLENGKHEMLYLTPDNALSTKDAISSFYISDSVTEITSPKETSSLSAPSISPDTTRPSVESKPQGTVKPKETTIPQTHISSPEQSSPPTSPSDAHTFPDPSEIHRLPQKDAELSLATILVILSSALIAVCFISVLILLIRYDRKYKKK